MTRARSAWGPEHLGVKAAGTEGPWRLKDLCRPSLLWPLVGIALLSALLAFAFTTTAAIAPVVQTTSGRLKGHEAAGTSSVSEYLGVPYAEPPLGSLRWAPPERFNVSSDSPIVDATNFGHSCPAATSVSLSTNFSNTGGVNVTPQGAEILVSMLGQAGVTYSEDCLTLNIWTKAPFGEQKKAVLFWVHGGAYSTGTTNQPAYIGKYLAEQQDVVVVTANYRLNIFGFPGAPNLRNNLGLLDHRLALEWTRDNIAAFGGDPSRITLFGQSAGASAVDYYSYAWTSDAIIAGIIAQSGTVFSPGSQATPSDAASAWYNVTSTLGCGDANSNAQYVVQCMRSKEWEAVQDAMPRSSALFGGGFGPTIDDIVVFSDYPARSVAGKLIKKPLMIGNNENEAGLFKPTLALQNISYSPEEWDALALVLFTCSVSTRALASIANGVPTWRYRWFGDFPDLKLTSTPNSGAWHGSEIPIIFGTDLDVQNVVDRTEAERSIISYMGGAWAAFAKDPTRGLTSYGMRRYSPLQPTLLQLAYNNLTGPNAVLPAKYDLSCPIPAILLGLASGLGLI